MNQPKQVFRIAKLEDAPSNAKNQKLIAEIQIERMVLLARHNRELHKTDFVFVSFNQFVHMECQSPAEFSACKFDLQSGVKSVFSTLVNPGQLCLGLAYKAMHHADNTHQLPLPPNAMGESMSKVYRDIIKFLNCSNGKPLIVFTPTQEMALVKGCFDHMQSASELDDIDDNEDAKKNPIPSILVYDIQYLLFILKKETIGMMRRPNMGIKPEIANAIFSSDYFEFEEGIACPFHEEIDRCRYCTRSKVIRWAFTFCDYICKDLGITMVPGKHAPIIRPPDTSSA